MAIIAPTKTPTLWRSGTSNSVTPVPVPRRPQTAFGIVGGTGEIVQPAEVLKVFRVRTWPFGYSLR